MTTWTTRDGRELLINEMETSHIKNTINYLLDNPIAFGSYGHDADDMCYDVDYDLTDDYIKTFKRELKRRNEQH